MKITLIQTGKTRFNYLKEGVNDYKRRLKYYINLEEITIPDLKNVSKLSFEEIKIREGELILKNCKTSDYVILLDEKGTNHSSIELAEYLQKKIISGKDIIMITGGAYGFSKSVYNRSNDLISLSRMTFSHQLVRLILAEQLYRAMTIIRGEPYHHS